MPLLDHFHPPLSSVTRRHSIAVSWLQQIVDDFNELLPPRFYAGSHIRSEYEIDENALERFADPSAKGEYRGWVPRWGSPPPSATVAFVPVVDEFDIHIHEEYPGDLRIVGVVMSATPANKDRPESRQAFVTKCHNYLLRGVGVVLIDVVTDKHFNLHNDLMAHIGHPARRMTETVYVTSYRTTGKNGLGKLETWEHPLAVGQALPTVPMWLLGGFCIPARLEETYTETLRRLRVPQRLADHAASVQRRATA